MRTATRLGTAGWDTRHDSDPFGIGAGTVLTWIGNRDLKCTERLAVPLADGVDDIALALTLDAYGRTLRTAIAIEPLAGAPGRCRATTAAQGTNRRGRGLPRRVL